MKIGVMQALTRDIDASFAHVRDLGMNNCQLTGWNHTLFTDEMAEAVRAASEKHGVTVSAFWCGWPGVSAWNFTEGPLTLGLVPREYRAERTRIFLEGAAFAAKIGVNDVVTHCGFLPENPCTTEHHEMVATLRYICRRLAAAGQYFLFETGQETPVTLLRMIEEVGTGNLGINLDPANLLMYGKGNPVDALRVFGKYVRGVHGKDGEYPTDGLRLGRERPLGEGLVDYPRFIAALRDAGYDGCITIEREISGEQQIKDILAAKAYLEELIAAN
ncbi:MAG: sugar phosphate isomerase/epimerase [Clostridia bacterium]|nr:sugar phosphate isomerase/epimerase [Clostridia bacterium]